MDLKDLTELKAADVNSGETFKIFASVDGMFTTINSSELKLVPEIQKALSIPDTAWGFIINSKGELDSKVGNSDAYWSYLTTFKRGLLVNSDSGATFKTIDPTDGTKLYDGTILDESLGNIMVYMPTLYYRMDEFIGGSKILWMCEEEFLSSKCWKEMCLGAYPGSVENNTLYSRSGKSFISSLTINQGYGRAHKNGSYYGIMHYEHIQRLFAMYIYEMGTTSFNDFILSNTWNESKSILTGTSKTMTTPALTCDTYTDENGLKHSCFFGIEDLFGLQWTSVGGIYSASSDNPRKRGNEVYITDANNEAAYKSPTTEELASEPNNPYRMIRRPIANLSITVRAFLFGENFDIIPKNINYDPHNGNYSGANSTAQGMWIGGYGDSETQGFTTICFEDWSFKYSMFGHRLAYFGDLIIEGE